MSAAPAARAVELAGELRRRLGPPPELADPPLVSIVVASHDGEEHLRTMLAGLVEHTDYPALELIVVDNGSSDGSIAFLRSAPAPFPISIVANQHNESFSDANNQGAELARGELLLLLNNDVQPFESGWLLELVACLRDHGGAAGATLIFPHEDRARFPHGFAVQHRGLRFRDEDGAIGPVLHEWEADPLDERLGSDIESPVVPAACLLVERALFERVGGFTSGYFYGSEDIDLCLKLREAGAPVVCSGRSLAIHRAGSTRAVDFEQARERKLRNHRLLLERWGPRLRREHDLDALAGGGMWVQVGREQGAAASSRAEAEALSVCVRASDPPGQGVGADPLQCLQEAAAVRGHRCLVLRGSDEEDPRGLELDVAIYVSGASRHLPVRGQFNVLWASEDLAAAEGDLYDLVLAADARQAIRLRASSNTPVVITPDEGVLDAALAAAQASGRPTRIDTTPARVPARRTPRRPPALRVVALLATYNERRFVEPCLEHLRQNGVDVYLIDNESTDETMEIAERYRGRGLIGAETLPREGDLFSLRAQLRRKEELARELEADWFIHLDADEVRLPPPSHRTLVEALAEVDRHGFTAVNFLELSFVPTRESPDHDHPEFEHTLRTYYPLLPEFPHQLKAWKATPDVELAWKAGHQARFPGAKMYPQSFLMKHYLFLSPAHAIEKYVRRRFPDEEIESGWHRWRAKLSEDDVRLPSESELRVARPGENLDSSNPSKYHCFDPRWTSPHVVSSGVGS